MDLREKLFVRQLLRIDENVHRDDDDDDGNRI